MAAPGALGVCVGNGLRITHRIVPAEDGLSGGAGAKSAVLLLSGGAGAAAAVHPGPLSGGAEAASAVFGVGALSARTEAKSVNKILSERTGGNADSPARFLRGGVAFASPGADVVRHLINNADVLPGRSGAPVFGLGEQVQRAAAVLAVPVKAGASAAADNIQGVAEMIEHGRPQGARSGRRGGQISGGVLGDVPIVKRRVGCGWIGSGGDEDADNPRVAVARGDNQQRPVGGVFCVGVASGQVQQGDDCGGVGGSRRFCHLGNQGGVVCGAFIVVKIDADGQVGVRRQHAGQRGQGAIFRVAVPASHAPSGGGRRDKSDCKPPQGCSAGGNGRGQGSPDLAVGGCGIHDGLRLRRIGRRHIQMGVGGQQARVLPVANRGAAVGPPRDVSQGRRYGKHDDRPAGRPVSADDRRAAVGDCPPRRNVRAGKRNGPRRVKISGQVDVCGDADGAGFFGAGVLQIPDVGASLVPGPAGNITAGGRGRGESDCGAPQRRPAGGHGRGQRSLDLAGGDLRIRHGLEQLRGEVSRQVHIRGHADNAKFLRAGIFRISDGGAAGVARPAGKIMSGGGPRRDGDKRSVRGRRGRQQRSVQPGHSHGSAIGRDRRGPHRPLNIAGSVLPHLLRTLPATPGHTRQGEAMQDRTRRALAGGRAFKTPRLANALLPGP